MFLPKKAYFYKFSILVTPLLLGGHPPNRSLISTILPILKIFCKSRIFYSFLDDSEGSLDDLFNQKN